MQAQEKIAELSEHKILNIKKCLHIYLHAQQNRRMIYNWLIMFSSEYK